MKKWLLVFLVLISACSLTGKVVQDPNQNFIDAENDLMDLASRYTVPEHPLVDSFKQQFGSTFTLKVYSTKFLLFDDKYVWYTITLEENKINIQKVDEPVTDWYFKINVDDVSSIIVKARNINGVGDVISIASSIGTEPSTKSLEIINWLRVNL